MKSRLEGCNEDWLTINYHDIKTAPLKFIIKGVKIVIIAHYFKWNCFKATYINLEIK